MVFDLNECRVYYKGKLVLSGRRDPRTELWQLPINPTSPDMAEVPLTEALNLSPGAQAPIPQTAANMHTIP